MIGRVLPLVELTDFADDVRRLFEDLEGAYQFRCPAGEWAPAVDVVETDSSVEILLDLPGVPAEAMRVLIKAGVVVIAGEKPPVQAASNQDISYHIVERALGRFARALRLTGAFDASQARATLRAGELHMLIPRINERRGYEIRVPITNEPDDAQESHDVGRRRRRSTSDR